MNYQINSPRGTRKKSTLLSHCQYNRG